MMCNKQALQTVKRMYQLLLNRSATWSSVFLILLPNSPLHSR